MKLLKLGVKTFKGLGSSMAYHFGSKSTQRITKNKGSKQFLNKWGITSSTMCKYILRRGEEATYPLNVEEPKKGFNLGKLKSKLKRIALSFSKTGQINEL